ncbi:hypothetical protein ACJX0J_027402, partial [Zea mays]
LLNNYYICTVDANLGFDSLHFARIDYQDKKRRKAGKGLSKLYAYQYAESCFDTQFSCSAVILIYLSAMVLLRTNACAVGGLASFIQFHVLELELLSPKLCFPVTLILKHRTMLIQHYYTIKILTFWGGCNNGDRHYILQDFYMEILNCGHIDFYSIS